jgi:inhibitor of KinA
MAAGLAPVVEPLGDAAVMIRFGDRIGLETHRAVRRFARMLEEYAIPAMTEYVPAYASVLVHYDVALAARMMERAGTSSPFEAVAGWCKTLLGRMDLTEEEPADPGSSDSSSSKEPVDSSGSVQPPVEIPVCYGGAFGPDLEDVARHNGLTPEEVVRIHSGTEYFTYMLGFLPGFPYLGGMSERIATPRKQTPRLRVPAGSVGIAGSQTGIYPLESPGGWQLIGRTPLALFRPEDDPPVLVKPGDRVRFHPISEREFRRLEAEQAIQRAKLRTEGGGP